MAEVPVAAARWRRSIVCRRQPSCRRPFDIDRRYSPPTQRMITAASDFLLRVSDRATFGAVTEMVSLPHRAPVYHLRTLGTLGLSGPGVRQVLGAHGHHRRR